MAKHEDILSKDPAEVEALAERLERGQLQEGDGVLAAKMLRLLRVVRLLERKRATILRLRRLLFGPKSDTRLSSPEQAAKDNRPESECEAGSGADSNSPQASSERPKRRGHGRLSSDIYQNAETVERAYTILNRGDPCPWPLCTGHLYDTDAPLVFIHFVKSKPVPLSWSVPA